MKAYKIEIWEVDIATKKLDTKVADGTFAFATADAYAQNTSFDVQWQYATGTNLGAYIADTPKTLAILYYIDGYTVNNTSGVTDQNHLTSMSTQLNLVFETAGEVE